MGATMLCAVVAATVTAQMISFPAVSFEMGSKEGSPDEQPVHTVTLDAFAIDKHEVSRASYDSCVKAGACSPAHYNDGKCLLWTSAGLRKVVVPEKYRSPDNPVVCVSWIQARAYCRHKNKRLPTEAEWEYAAGKGTQRRYAWGDEPPDQSRCAPRALRRPAVSGSFAPGPGGLYDMTGNVWEWVRDRYQADFYAVSPESNPKGPPVGRYRVIRGGGWYSAPEQLRIRNRQWMAPEAGEVSVGFRCAR